MAEESDQSSKTEEPTQRKLDDARRKGDVAKSMDVPQWASLAAVFGVLAIAGGWMARNLAEAFLPFVASPDKVEVSGEGLRSLMATTLVAAAPAVIIVMFAAALAGGAGHLLQTGFLFSPSKLAPDLKKLSPIAGFKRLFGVDALVQFFKSLVKLIAIAVVVWLVFQPHADELENLAAMEPAALLPFSRDLLIALFFAVLALLAFGAAVDFVWQRFRFMQRMKMSREELKEDFKQSEGDPHVKAKLKQIRADKARQRMMQNVPKATVVITNPTHFAVALRYVQGETAAPVCVAKGVDAVALRIREVATEHEVPILEDPPLARALYASMEVDDVIPHEHFQAVAKIIGFILGSRSHKAAGAAPRHS
ncbi:MAG TPA: flagellar biosynthesis protein FlhB [Caulobacteraceae bacterium]